MPHDRGVIHEFDTFTAKLVHGGIDIFNLRTYVIKGSGPSR